MSEFEYKSIDQKKQEVLEDWLELTQRKIESINPAEFLNHPSLGNLSVQNQQIRKDIGKSLIKKKNDGFVLKLEEWLDAVYDFTIKNSETRGVWISKGSVAFHIERQCEWFQKGLNFKADFHQRSAYKEEFVSEKNAISLGKRPCKSCSK